MTFFLVGSSLINRNFATNKGDTRAYDQTWINFMGDCWEIVEKLMKINRNKDCYLRGMRAMKPIVNVLCHPLRISI